MGRNCTSEMYIQYLHEPHVSQDIKNHKQGPSYAAMTRWHVYYKVGGITCVGQGDVRQVELFDHLEPQTVFETPLHY